MEFKNYLIPCRFITLSSNHGKCARRTCRHWLDTIAGCPGLRNKFWLTFPHDRKITKINRNYKPPGTLPASNVEFKLANYSKIGSTNAWWPQVASTVTCLVMGGCEFPVDMLRHAPNLKTLELESARVVGSAEVDFTMDNLRKLLLIESNPGQLSHMITRLEVLECQTENEDWDNLCSIVELIKSVQLTLAELTAVVPARYLLEFAQLRELRLKKVCLYGYTKSVEMVSFVQGHPSIEDLILVDLADDNTLCNTLRALTNLKRLKLGYMAPFVDSRIISVLPKIPNTLSNLECLQIECIDYWGCPRLHIQRGCQFPKLKELHIESVTLKGESLRKSLRSSLDLHTLTLDCCEFESWNQLFRLITEPEKLRSLTFLLTVDFKRIDPDQFIIKPCESLRYLRICVELPFNDNRIQHNNNQIAALFRLFPHLTELDLDFGVNDEQVKKACRTMTRLERLTMRVRSTTHKAIEYIRRYCHNLKQLKLIGVCKMNMEDYQYFEQNLDRFSHDRVEMKFVSSV